MFAEGNISYSINVQGIELVRIKKKTHNLSYSEQPSEILEKKETDFLALSGLKPC